MDCPSLCTDFSETCTQWSPNGSGSCLSFCGQKSANCDGSWICSFPMTGERENTCLILCQFLPLLICRLLLSWLPRQHRRALSAQWYRSKCCVKHVPLWHLLHCNRTPTRPASAGSHFKMSTLSGLQAIISSVISEWTSAPELQEMLIQVITAALLAPVVAGRGRSPLWGL